jgi:hypothetical protein
MLALVEFLLPDLPIQLFEGLLRDFYSHESLLRMGLA